MRATIAAAIIALVALAGCGGPDEAETAADTPEETSGQERAVQESDGAQIEGLMGTISPDAVERGMEARMGRFLRCFQQRHGALEVLGGSIELAFRVRVDGSVLWVHPRASTIGDRETERCILQAAQGTRFQPPRGGEAEFSYPLTLDTPPDVRPPLNWDASRVAEHVERSRGEIVDCGPGPYTLTLYIAPGGQVLAAGAATPDPERAGDLDCVARVVAGWSMPDPGSYPAKVTFSL